MKDETKELEEKIKELEKNICSLEIMNKLGESYRNTYLDELKFPRKYLDEEFSNSTSRLRAYSDVNKRKENILDMIPSSSNSFDSEMKKIQTLKTWIREYKKINEILTAKYNERISDEPSVLKKVIKHTSNDYINTCAPKKVKFYFDEKWHSGEIFAELVQKKDTYLIGNKTIGIKEVHSDNIKIFDTLPLKTIFLKEVGYTEEQVKQILEEK